MRSRLRGQVVDQAVAGNQGGGDGDPGYEDHREQGGESGLPPEHRHPAGRQAEGDRESAWQRRTPVPRPVPQARRRPNLPRDRRPWRGPEVPNASTLLLLSTTAAVAAAPSRRVERKGGKTGNHRALRASAGSRRGRRGRSVLQAPLLGAAGSKRRDRPGVRGVLFEVPQAPLSAAGITGWRAGRRALHRLRRRLTLE